MITKGTKLKPVYEYQNANVREFLNEKSLILSPRTMYTFRQVMKIFDKWLPGRLKEEGFTRRIAVNFLMDMKADGYATSMVWSSEKVLRTFYTWLAEMGITPAHAFTGRKVIEYHWKRRGETFPFKPAQYEKVRDYLKREWSDTEEDYWHGMIIVGWNTGMRFSDCAQLHWVNNHIDLDRKSIRLTPQKQLKQGREIEIPMSTELYNYLKAVPFKAGYLFPKLAERLQAGDLTLNGRFTILCGWGGVRYKSFHALRHAMASRLLNNGVPISVVSEITGQSLQTLQQYSHVKFAQKADAIRLLEQSAA